LLGNVVDTSILTEESIMDIVNKVVNGINEFSKKNENDSTATKKKGKKILCLDGGQKKDFAYSFVLCCC